MSEPERFRLLRSLDRPVTPPTAVALQIWSVVESELTDSPSLTRSSGHRARPRWRGPVAASAAAVVVLATGFATWALMTPRDQPVAPTTTTAPTTTAPTMTSLPQAPPDAVVGTSEDGFAEVIAALDQASARWQPAEDFGYAFRVTVTCDCPHTGTRWVRKFQQGPPEGDPWDVLPILSRIRTDIAAGPDRVEVAFSAEDGHPTYYSVRWPEDSDADDLVLGVDEFHEITLTTSEFDGTYRFTSGVVDGSAFDNPVLYGAIFLSLDTGFASFPVDCNTGGAMIDIHQGAFGAGPIGATDVGCPEYTSEADLFLTGVEKAETISANGSDLLLAGPGVELHFVEPQPAESRGQLPLTAAGETLLLEFPNGRARGVVYTIGGQGEELGQSVQYVLTAEAAGVDSVAGWEEWHGEFDVPECGGHRPGAGSDRRPGLDSGR